MEGIICVMGRGVSLIFDTVVDVANGQLDKVMNVHVVHLLA